jgi:predicted AAA+ superfamily ATPase
VKLLHAFPVGLHPFFTKRMGLFARILNKLKKTPKEARVLLLGLDCCGKTTILKAKSIP